MLTKTEDAEMPSNRACALCHKMGEQDEMLMIRQRRYEILKKWYPENMQGKHDWVHKNCLAHLGLHPFPRGRVHFEQLMGSKVLGRIKEVMTENSDIRGARKLIDVVHRRLCDEYHIPTAEGRRQMRYLVSHWITTHMADERGGVAVEEDCSEIETITDGDVIEQVDTGLCISTAASIKAVSSDLPVDDGMVHPGEVLRAPTETLQMAIQFMNAFATAQEKYGEAQEKVATAMMAKKAAIDSEIELLREKRKAPEETEQRDLVLGKRPKTEERLDEQHPQWLGQRYSISHHALAVLQKERGDRNLPPIERVFTIVQDWFSDRLGKVGKCQLNVKTVIVCNVPVVYGYHDGKHRFRGSKHEEQLHQYVMGRVWPAEMTKAIQPPVELPIAPFFLKPSVGCPPELQPISMEQQEADIQRVCELLKLSPTQWPNRADAGGNAANPCPAFIKQWNSIKSTHTAGIGEWIRRLGCTPTAFPRRWLYTIAVLMRQLEGWSSQATTIMNQKGYIKAAVPFIRRVLLVTRGMGMSHPMSERMQKVLQEGAD